ncbi:PREDICTED: uncharacterized protein LOC108769765 [Trachymyrmex cornetzi]|nr:PREDICTED: uncharacterized protein LOC108769765 [Trachymyrmex cornetzi]
MPMGSPLSPILADLVIQDLESDILTVAIPNNQVEEVLSLFNSYHDRLKCTVEERDDGSVNFLDETVILKEGQIKFDNYKKPTNSGRYLSYKSYHPEEHKRVLRKVEKEKEELKIDLRASRMEISNLRQEIEEVKKEEKSLRQTIHQADSDIVRQKKNIDNVMNERDILGTQLVRRNDELSLQYSRMKV